MALIVVRKKGETKDDLIGRFRRLSLEKDVSEEIKERTAYRKPSERRYAKKKIILWREKCRRRAKQSRRYAQR